MNKVMMKNGYCRRQYSVFYKDGSSKTYTIDSKETLNDYHKLIRLLKLSGIYDRTEIGDAIPFN